jgi:hypothetical protein
MHNITSYLLVFKSPKTVQYRRRLHLPKFGPETDSRFQFSSLFRLSVFRRASPSRLCSVFHKSCRVRILGLPSFSTFFVSLKSVHRIVAATALKTVHFRYLQEFAAVKIQFVVSLSSAKLQRCFIWSFSLYVYKIYLTAHWFRLCTSPV